MKQEVVKKESQVPAAMTAEAWGADVAIGGQDIVIAKILPMQGMSQLVDQGTAKVGEMRDSLTGALIAGIDQAFDFIPFHVEKFWDVYEGGEFTRTEPLIENPQQAGYNDNLQWQDGETKRVRRMNFYGLLAGEVEAGTSVPYILSFKSMSFKEGKKLFTQMYLRNRRANLPPCGFVVRVKGVKRENDKGKFIVPVIELGRKANEGEVKEAYNWYTLIKKGGVKVDDSDVKGQEAGNVDLSDTAEF